jgi:hypothetical protein
MHLVANNDLTSPHSDRLLEFAHLADGLGEFLPTPTTVDDVTSVVTRMLMKAAAE